MARIRSVHPSLWTDEAFVSCSTAARLLLIGIWTDADDQGVFEWRPLQLRMRLCPADDVDVVGLLEELRAANTVRPFEAGGARYGAIRNFRKDQRPKKPNAIHPLPDEFRTYVALAVGGAEPGRPDGEAVLTRTGTGPPPVPNQSATRGGKPLQMEDVGEDVINPQSPQGGGSPLDPDFQRAWEAFPLAGRASSSPEQAHAAWLGALSGGVDLAGLSQAVAAFARSDYATAKGGARVPGMHRWLNTGRFKAFLPAQPATRWTGPGDVRGLIARAFGEGGDAFLRSSLDRCGWQDVPTQAVVCPTSFIADKLEKNAGEALRSAGVAIILERAA